MKTTSYILMKHNYEEAVHTLSQIIKRDTRATNMVSSGRYILYIRKKDNLWRTNGNIQEQYQTPMS